MIKKEVIDNLLKILNMDDDVPETTTWESGIYYLLKIQTLIEIERAKQDGIIEQ